MSPLFWLVVCLIGLLLLASSHDDDNLTPA